MRTYEEELKKVEPITKRLINFALLGKKIEIRGKENLAKKGPVIIVSNHIGSFKDIAVLSKIMPRPIFFAASKRLFSRDELNLLIKEYFHRYFKGFGFFLSLVLNPLKFPFVNFITNNIAKTGSVPVDPYHGYRNVKFTIKKFQEYLEQERAIILFQGSGHIMRNDQNPYISSFERGFSVIAYNLEKKGISVPVIPLAIFGTHLPISIPAKIWINVGSPMYISDYLTGKRKETVEKFKNALEIKTKTLFFKNPFR